MLLDELLQVVHLLDVICHLPLVGHGFLWPNKPKPFLGPKISNQPHLLGFEKINKQNKYYKGAVPQVGTMPYIGFTAIYWLQ